MKNCIIICGTTASGKSKIAEHISQQVPAHIINADSQQIYEELPILTDQPNHQDDKYKLYGYKTLFDDYNSFMWAQDASQAVYDAINAGKMPILVGGTGFYIRNLLHGHDCLKTNAPKTYFCTDVNFIKILIMPPKEHILPKAKQRIYEMFPDVIQEVQSVQNLTRAKGLCHNCHQIKICKIIGFQEVVNYCNNLINIDDCVSQILIRTMQYAKRQRTWFRHQMQYDFILSQLPSDQDMQNITQFVLSKIIKS